MSSTSGDITFPFELRARLAYDGKLLLAVTRIAIDSVLGFYKRRMRIEGRQVLTFLHDDFAEYEPALAQLASVSNFGNGQDAGVALATAP